MNHALTVLIPCKNERENLGPCVDSVRGLADEILIADSGSTDGTLELIRSWSDCRLIEREFVDSGDFKNWAIPQAKHTWVLILDADERLTPALQAEIRATLTTPPAHQAYRIRRRNHFMGHPVRYTAWAKDEVIRLIHRDRARYSLHTDHAEISLPSVEIGKLTEPMIHYTCWDYDTYLPKMLRYTEQQAALWYRQGKRPSLWKLLSNGPLRFLRSYVLELGILDGRVGFQISMLTGFYSFLKQARLWQLHAGRRPLHTDRATA
jgi:glycosyltransferase involved in cell wall biosynthesis